MSNEFNNQDMAGARFHNVNLHKAVFEGVNLSEATITDANLGGLKIDDAYIGGLTILGFRIDKLIDAEKDRLDPVRVQLRMADRFDPDCVRTVLARLGEVRDNFVEWLRTLDHNQLTTRPTSEQWSVLELVRHLVFAEELYTDRWILQNDENWNPLGQLPTFLADNPAYEDVGQQPVNDLEEILTAWSAVHARLRKFTADICTEELQRSTHDIDFGQGTVGGVLQGMAIHDLEHIRQAEAVVQALE